MSVTSVEPSEADNDADRPNNSSNIMTALLLDYQMARDDDRAAQTVLSAMIGVAIALLGALIASLNYPLSREAFAIAPLLPLGAISYILLVGSSTTMRSFYMRALEEELRRRLFADTDLALLQGIKPMSGTEFIISVSSGARGRPALRVAYAVIMGAILLVFGGVAILIGYKVGGVYAILMLAVYAPLALLLFIEGVVVGIAGRSAFQAEISRFRADGYASIRKLGNLENIGKDRRSLLSYLLLPRPGDLIKWTFVPIAAVLGLLLPGVFSEFSTSDLWSLIIGWLAFEYLAYQARYQINDLRGLEHDLGHPRKISRMRLPVLGHGIRTSIKATLWAVAARLAVLLIVLVLNPFDLRQKLGIAVLAVFLIAVPYEYLRSRAPTDPDVARRLAMLIWILVGAGYAIRVCLGLSLVGISSPAVLAIFGLTSWLFGVMFVTLTWVLEATSYLYMSELGQYHYLGSAKNGSAPEDEGGEHGSASVKTGLEGKPHVLHLLPFICVNATWADANARGSECSKVRFLESRPTLLNPWNLSLLGATVSVIFACNLASRSPDFAVADGGVLVMASASAFLLSVAKSTPVRWGVLAVGLLAFLTLSAVLSVDYTWTAAGAFIIFGALYIFFGASSYDDIVSFNEKAAVQISRAKHAVIRVVIGRGTSELFKSALGKRSDDADARPESETGAPESGRGAAEPSPRQPAFISSNRKGVS